MVLGAALGGLPVMAEPSVGPVLSGREATDLLKQAAQAAADGDSDTAATIWQQLLPWVRQQAPPGSAMLPQSLLQVGEVEQSLGHLGVAERTYLEALELARGLPQPRPQLIAILQNNLADVYADLERFAEAKALLQQSLELKISILGANHLEVGVGHSNLADLLREMGELDASENQSKRALDVLTPLASEHPLALAAALNNAAQLYQKQGQWDQAEQALARAQQLRIRALPANHPDLALGWNNLGMLALSRGDFKTARESLQKAHTQTQQIYGTQHHLTARQVANLARLATDQGQLQDAIQGLEQAQEILDARLGPEHPDSLNNLAELLLVQQRRGPQNSLIKPLERLLRSRFALLGNQAWQLSPRERLLMLRRRDLSWYLADALASTDPQAAPLAMALRINTQGLMQDVQREQTQAGQPAPSSHAPREWLQPADVAIALPPNSVLIELRRYLDPSAVSDDPATDLPWRYRAYVLRRNADVQVVELGAAAVLEPLIRQAYRASAEELLDAEQRWADVDQSVLQPLRAVAGEAKVWFLALDAGLYQVPFQALATERTIHLLNTGRDLLRFRRTASTSATAPVVAGNPTVERALPATSNEVDGVARLLRGKAVTGPAFNSAMLNQLNSPLVLHLASHGFWKPGRDPMLSSGIEVSPSPISASTVHRANTIGQSGRFNAAQFLTLNLSGTELVTLSACSTGLGDLHDSEGIFGLLRAVQVAGARTVLTSLWPVDDDATRDWMLRYYHHLVEGVGRGDALVAVQTEFRNHPNPIWRHPYYWAGWQLTGDWGPIHALTPHKKATQHQATTSQVTPTEKRQD